jgi:hypothetical protein
VALDGVALALGLGGARRRAGLYDVRVQSPLQVKMLPVLRVQASSPISWMCHGRYLTLNQVQVRSQSLQAQALRMWLNSRATCRKGCRSQDLDEEAGLDAVLLLQALCKVVEHADEARANFLPLSLRVHHTLQ